MTALIGADAGRLHLAAAELRVAAGELDAHAGALTFSLRSVTWIGGASSRFLGHWNGSYRPRLSSASAALRAAADQLDHDAAEQTAVSAANGGSASIGAVFGGLAGLGTAAGGIGGAVDGIDDVVDALIDFFSGDIANLWNGGDDGVPLGRMAAALARIVRTRAFLVGGLVDELFPVFNTGRIGVTLAGALEQIPGLAGAGRWLASPAATTSLRVVGAVGGGVSTAIGVYDLYRQGNPVDAFRREGAGYVADVAGTAFSASTTAFLVAPNPVTGALVIGTGAVWVGAEVVDHWDEITGWTSDAWDAGSDVVGDAWDAGTDFIGDVGGGAVDFVGGLFG